MLKFNKIKALCCLVLAIAASTCIFTACTFTHPHTCADVCDDCGKCNSECTDPVCTEKCECQPVASKFTVTFSYGFDPENFDEATGYASEYLNEYKATVESGKKFSVSSTLKNAFDCVEGYKLVGYDTNAWNTAVTEDMEVKVKYEKLPEVTVTFVDALGDEIKEVVSYETGALTSAQLPDSANPIYLLSSEQYANLSDSEKVNYQVYEKDNTKYIEKSDVSRLGEALVLPLGEVFTGWNGQLAGFTQDVTVSPTTKQSTAVIGWSNSALTIDGEKDAAYVSMGKIWRKQADSTDYSVSYSDEEWASFNFECELFMAWDGDYMYFYVDVTDNHVISYGKDYNEKIENPFVQDNIEIWYSLGGYRRKFIIDAFGYKFHSVAAQTSGVSAYFEDFVANNYVTKLKGANLEEYKNNTAVEATGATGYVVEFAMPCYYEPTSNGELGSTVGSENWGEAMKRGHYFYVGLQADNVDSVMNAESINACVTANNCNSADATFTATEFDAYGYQITSDKRTANAWLLVLG